MSSTLLRNMTKRTVMSAALLALASLPACGTAFSRGSGSVFGAYPFHAVAIDGCFMSKTFNAPESFMGLMVPGPVFLIWGLVSLPVDLAVDVLLLPIDLGAWILGDSKPSRRTQPAPGARSEYVGPTCPRKPPRP